LIFSAHAPTWGVGIVGRQISQMKRTPWSI
jgi:hypothetical protein